MIYTQYADDKKSGRCFSRAVGVQPATIGEWTTTMAVRHSQQFRQRIHGVVRNLRGYALTDTPTASSLDYMGCSEKTQFI